MTDNIQTQINVGPLVQVVMSTGQEMPVFPFSDIARDDDDPATISDADLLARIANHLDRPLSDFGGLVVTRPATGNILCAPKAQYGAMSVILLRLLVW